MEKEAEEKQKVLKALLENQKAMQAKGYKSIGEYLYKEFYQT